MAHRVLGTPGSKYDCTCGYLKGASTVDAVNHTYEYEVAEKWADSISQEEIAERREAFKQVALAYFPCLLEKDPLLDESTLDRLERIGSAAFARERAMEKEMNDYLSAYPDNFDNAGRHIMDIAQANAQLRKERLATKVQTKSWWSKLWRK